MAREVVTLHEFLNKLDPAFDDCPGQCAYRDGEERESFCDECDAGAQYKFFQESFRETKEKRGLSDDFTFAQLYRDVNRILVANSAKPRGYPKGCSALEAKLFDVMRYELSRPERRRAYALRLKIEEAEAQRARDGR